MAKPLRANLTAIRPILGIKSYKEAIEYYVDWLGFSIEWEWRESPGSPSVVQIARDGIAIQLLEGDEHPSSAWIQILIEDIESLVDELNHKRPNSAELADNFPYVRQINTTDPFGNQLVFEQPVTDTEKLAMDERAEKMRRFIRARLADGQPCPTPEEVAEALFPPPTFSTKVHAVDVLFEFQEYSKPDTA